MRRIAAFAISIFVFIPLRDAQLYAQTRSDTIVKVAAQPRYRRIATLAPRVTIGSIDAHEDYQFGHIRALLAAKDGSIWVIDGRGTTTA